ncbi:GDSL-type esterase/lipase family protein [Glaesserella sp.]|uniref:GDSL-type esterase/lipase family protein n=1 Tax=Glaesserella sp. TaxID=2094731 RepID=UPI0035A0B798
MADQLSPRTQYIKKHGFLSDQEILNRYQAKYVEFEKQAEISLLGHSLFDLWMDIDGYQPMLAGKSTANLGISGISAFQYLDLIVRPKRIKWLGDTVFLFLGVNDIAKELDYSPENLVKWLTEIVDGLKQISPHSNYYLLEVTPTLKRENVTNEQIRQLNRYLKQHCPNALHFIETYQAFSDENQDLRAELTSDGIHFTKAGYDVLVGLLRQFVK